MLYLAENIKYLRNKKGLSQEGFAEELGISRNQQATYEDGRASPKLETLVRYSEYFRIPVDALLKTNLTKGRESTYIDIGSHRVLFPVMVDASNEDLIEVVTKEASAGYLTGYSDTEYISDLPIMNLSFLPTGKHRAFPIKGDSMNPYVHEGDFVVGKFVEELEQVKDGKCYVVLSRNDGLVYKRVYKEKKEFLSLHSDNKLYNPYDLHLSEVLEIWEFTLNLAFGQYKQDELNPSNVMNLLRSMQVELKTVSDKVNKL